MARKIKYFVVIYGLKRSSAKQKTRIQRELYGYIDYSFNKKYKYKRKGLIEELGGKKIKRSVVAIPYKNSKNRKKLLNILVKNNATVYIESTVYM